MADAEKFETTELHGEATIPGVLGERLKRVYDRMLAEPIPDRFVELMQMLDARAEAAEDSHARSQGRQAMMGDDAR